MICSIFDGLNDSFVGDYAWFCGNIENGPESVATKRPNGFIYDMHGNIWEWTADYNDCDFLSTNNLFW